MDKFAKACKKRGVNPNAIKAKLAALAKARNEYQEAYDNAFDNKVAQYFPQEESHMHEGIGALLGGGAGMSGGMAMASQRAGLRKLMQDALSRNTFAPAAGKAFKRAIPGRGGSLGLAALLTLLGATGGAGLGAAIKDK
jgi:hypothetical protein